MYDDQKIKLKLIEICVYILLIINYTRYEQRTWIIRYVRNGRSRNSVVFDVRNRSIQGRAPLLNKTYTDLGIVLKCI